MLVALLETSKHSRIIIVSLAAFMLVTRSDRWIFALLLLCYFFNGLLAAKGEKLVAFQNIENQKFNLIIFKQKPFICGFIDIQ